MHEHLFEREVVCKERENVKDETYEKMDITDPSENSFFPFEQDKGRRYYKGD